MEAFRRSYQSGSLRRSQIASVLCYVFLFIGTRWRAEAYKWNESWYNSMPVDHFSYDSNATFRLRYLINTEQWLPKFGPMFFYCGNEGNIEGFAENTGFMWDNAKTFNAMLVFAEHRYYGKSLPFGNLSRNMLGKLSSSQALADFAVLISHLKSTFSKTGYLPVIAFGGSYGGMLAAWMRIKYPHLVDGAIAASAPVAQFPGLTPCSTFTDITSEVFRNASNSCAASISRSWGVIRKLGNTTKGRRRLADIFKLCSEDYLASEDNVTQLMDWLSDIYGTLAMVNYPYKNEFLKPVPGWPVKVACDHLNHAEVDGTELLEAIYKAASVYLNYTGAVSCNKMESDYGSSVDGELWEYQACTEMVMPMCNSESGMFEKRDWNETEFAEKCSRKFGVRSTDSWAVSNYGGRNLASITKIVFSNGWLDPWRGGGILSSDHGITSLIIEDGAHHYDLRGHHPQDTPSVAKTLIFEFPFWKDFHSRWSYTELLSLMSNSYTPGWNDPPALPTSSGLAKCVSSRSLLSRRAFFSAGSPAGTAHDSSREAASCAPFFQPFHSAQSAPNMLVCSKMPPLPSHIGQSGECTPTMFFSCGTNGAADSLDSSLDAEAETQGDVVELSNGEIVSVLEDCLRSCEKLSDVYRESIVKRIAVLETALQTSSVSRECRQKLSLLVNHLANQRYISAYELHSLLMLNYFSEVHSWMAGVTAIILECQKQHGNCVRESQRMRLARVLYRHKNTVDQYRFWQVEKTRGPSRSKQTGKRKPFVPVRPKHCYILKAQLDNEHNVMRCLATPYLTKEQESSWHKNHGTPEEQEAKKRNEEEERHMPGQPKFVTGITKVDEYRGNIGNLLHSPRTLEQHFAHLTVQNQFE